MTPKRESEERFIAAIPDALQMVAAVHDGDPGVILSAFNAADIQGMVVVLATMVDQDKGVRELLAWAERPSVPDVLCHPDTWGASRGSKAKHGTRSRYDAGCRGSACKTAESVYQQARHLRRKKAHLTGARVAA